MALVVSASFVAACGLTARDAVDGEGAGGSAPEPANETPATPPELTPAVSDCSCDAVDRVVHLSKECFCAGFPELCVTYEEAKRELRYGPGGQQDRCAGASRWAATERIGCGRRVLSRPGAFAGVTWRYDEATLELIGVETYNDTAFGPCGAYAYSTGELSGCSEGSVCSLCDDTCAPECSLEAFESRYQVLPTYDDWIEIALAECERDLAREERPTLVTACGLVTVSTTFGSATFSERTHACTFVRWPGVEECGGEWGDPPSTCDTVTGCSVCDDEDDRCEL